MSDLDTRVLAHAVASRKYMLELTKNVKTTYFSTAYRDFYTALSNAFLDPGIKEILGVEALGEYCTSYGLAHCAINVKGVYSAILKHGIDSDGDFKLYLKLLKERFNREFIAGAAKNISSWVATDGDIHELNKRWAEANREILSIDQGKASDEGTLGDDISNIYKEYRSISTTPEDFRGVLSGFESLDSLTNGFFGGELIIVAGFEGSGKSLVCMNWGIHAWMGSNTIDTKPEDFTDDGTNVLYISLEMPRSNRGVISSAAYLNKRMVSCIGEVGFSNLRKGSLDDDELSRFKQTCRFIQAYDKKKKLFVADMPRGVGVDDVEAKILEVSEQMDIGLIIIDYIGLMKGAEDQQDWQAQGEIAAGLHELARVYNKPIITPCQVNRPGGSGHSLSNQKYNTTRLARASGISQNANMVLVIESRDNEHQYQDMTVQIVKMRDAEKGEIQFIKGFDKMRIYDPSSGMGIADLGDFIGVPEVAGV